MFYVLICVTVVSQLWGTQCIRLKVTVKSDNCGENADCSNKGVCFSNVSMVRQIISGLCLIITRLKFSTYNKQQIKER